MDGSVQKTHTALPPARDRASCSGSAARPSGLAVADLRNLHGQLQTLARLVTGFKQAAVHVAVAVAVIP